MSTTDIARDELILNEPSVNPTVIRLWQSRFASPWFLLAVLQLPYVALYLYYLWASTHYQFYPVLMGAVGYLVYSRWSDQSATLAWRRFGFVCGVIGVTLSLFSSVVVSPWLAYLGFALTIVAWLAPATDNRSGASLCYLAWPLFLVWKPPYNDIATADTYLITFLQKLSASLSSPLLDILTIPHYMQGTIITLADRSFGVEEACSGVQSFFAILCIAAMLMVWNRRSLIHSLIVVVSSIVWAIVMNTLRITVIPPASLWLSIDLSHGMPHQILGFATMGLAFWMLYSTDNLLVYWFGSGEADLDPDESVKVARTNKQTWSLIVYPILLLLSISAVVQSLDLQKKAVRLVGGNIFLPLQGDDLPSNINEWQKVSYQQQRRTNDADFGEQSDVWIFQDSDHQATFSLDQTFRLWHDLTVCYGNTGWKIVEQNVVFGDDDQWPVVSAFFERNDGRHAIVMFCLFDRAGQPLEVPGYESWWSSIGNRIAKRFSFDAGDLFREQTCYQAQVFAVIDAEQKSARQDAALALLEVARNQIRNVGLQRLRNENATNERPQSNL